MIPHLLIAAAGLAAAATMQAAGIRIDLPVYGQELLELAPPPTATNVVSIGG